MLMKMMLQICMKNQRRWVSDKLREGKKALEIMIQKKIVILEIGEIANGF